MSKIEQAIYELENSASSPEMRKHILAAIAALQAQLDGEREPEPLTLEQLKQMDGEPVYVRLGDGDQFWASAMPVGGGERVKTIKTVKNN